MEQAVHIGPWRSIRDGVVEPSGTLLGADDARESPCLSCSTSPCCTHLPVHSFEVATLNDLSYVDYLLNFDHIRVGMSRTGEWSAYYVQPCRFLDRDEFLCTVHDQPEQPQICRQYNPYSCWYRRVLTTSVNDEFLLVDRSRLAVLWELAHFDEHRRLVALPTWHELAERFHDLSDAPLEAPEPPIDDPPYEEWVKVTMSPRRQAPALDVPADHGFSDDPTPCNGCSAPCCETLTFPQGFPVSRSSLDFLRFALGFPGVEITVTDQGWWLTVKTRCRHLVGSSCSIYGRPERPLTCRYYDEWSCSYRHEFGSPVPDTILRVRLEHFLPLVEPIRFDDNGTVVRLPPLDELRASVESAVRNAAHA